MELKQILEELNQEYKKYCQRQDRITKSFFEENKYLIDIHISVLNSKFKELYLRALLSIVDNESKRLEKNISIFYNFDPQLKTMQLFETALYQQDIYKEYKTKLDDVVYENKQEAPDKPQEQAKEALKEKATAKVKAINEVDVNRIYQAMAKAGIIEEEPTAKRLIELHFKGLSENNIRAKNKQAKTDKSKNPKQLNSFIMELIKMIYDKTNIQHLDNLSSEIDNYIEKLETTYSKYS